MSEPLFVGRMRLHFNRHNAAPLVWSVVPLGDDDEPLYEINVHAVLITVKSWTVYRKKVEPDDEDGRPSAWIETLGALRLSPDGATISPD